MRARVPHEGQGAGLRVYGVRKAVTWRVGFRLAMEKWRFRKWSRAWRIVDLSLCKLARGIAWQRKPERGAWPVVRLGAETPPMPFDDRAAHEQPDPHSAAL